MGRRINIVLPAGTIESIDRMVASGGRSKFIDEAVRYFIENRSREALRKRLEFTAIRDRDLDLEVMADWAAVDEETWRRIDWGTDNVSKPRKATGRAVARSTSRRSTRPSGGKSRKPAPL
jgi:CopG family transcriptional regulator/antitoxin EndoAI